MCAFSRHFMIKGFPGILLFYHKRKVDVFGGSITSYDQECEFC